MSRSDERAMLEVQDVHMTFGVLKALNGVNLKIRKGAEPMDWAL